MSLDRPQQFQEDHSQATVTPEKSIEMQCFDALLELLDLTAKIVEHLFSRQSPLRHRDYLVIAGLDADLKAWYSRLSGSLAWTQNNIETAPIPYFHLQ